MCSAPRLPGGRRTPAFGWSLVLRQRIIAAAPWLDAICSTSRAAGRHCTRRATHRLSRRRPPMLIAGGATVRRGRAWRARERPTSANPRRNLCGAPGRRGAPRLRPGAPGASPLPRSSTAGSIQAIATSKSAATTATSTYCATMRPAIAGSSPSSALAGGGRGCRPRERRPVAEVCGKPWLCRTRFPQRGHQGDLGLKLLPSPI